MSDPRAVIHPSKQAVADAGAARLLTAILDDIAEHGRVDVSLTGGSLGSDILASLRVLPGADAIDWSRVHLWWGDERYLPAGDPERNQSQNAAALLDAVAIPPANVHAIAGPDASADAEASAAAYGQDLREHGSGDFDIMLLGVGPDGHIASLFPHHPAQRATGAAAVAVHDSPKPPPDRVSLTFECLNRSRRVWFIVAGTDKATAVASALAPGADRWDVPASGVRGSEETIWLLDTDAAAELPSAG